MACRFDNFECDTDQKKKALDQVKSHVEGDQVNTSNLILIGPTGTGKDHLTVAGVFHGLGVAAIAPKHSIAWCSGSVLFSELRSAMSERRCEGDVVSKYESSDVLIVSDPLEAGQELTSYQRQIWYRIIDYRYNNYLPIWMSLNATGKEQMIEMLGAAIVDRLADGATIVGCDWDSHRKASSGVERK